MLLIAALLLVVRWRCRRPMCPACDYSLHSLPTQIASHITCPECGRTSHIETLRFRRVPRSRAAAIGGIGAMVIVPALVQWYRNYKWIDSLGNEQLIRVATHVGPYDKHVMNQAASILYSRAVRSYVIPVDSYLQLQSLLSNVDAKNDSAAAQNILFLVGSGVRYEAGESASIKVCVFSHWIINAPPGSAMPTAATDDFLESLATILEDDQSSLFNLARSMLIHLRREDAILAAEMLVSRAKTSKNAGPCISLEWLAEFRPDVASDAAWWSNAQKLCNRPASEAVPR
jgi:predicted RNA-binding Zn-ribbon protein involved in translation (DUF1610 family)